MGTVEGDAQSGQDVFHDDQFGCKELELLKATDSSSLNYRISVILRRERERGEGRRGEEEGRTKKGREEREGEREGERGGERFIKSFYLRCTVLHTHTHTHTHTQS